MSGTILAPLNRIGAATSALADGASTLSALLGGLWSSRLQPASYRGITFYVAIEDASRGRRTAVHDYPYRDGVWGEDTGRAERLYRFTGFVLGDDCFAQAKRLLDAAEQPGSGDLVHPWLGTAKVAQATPARTRTGEVGRFVEIEFDFVESIDPVYPSAGTDTQGLVSKSSIGSLLASASSFVSQIAGGLQYGASVISSAIATVQGYSGAIQSLIGDASIVSSAVAGLIPPDGRTYGRYNNGARGALLSGVSDVPGAIAAVTTARAVTTATCTQAVTAMASVSIYPQSACAAIQAAPEALRACCNDPADATRLLSSLAAYAPVIKPGVASIGLAIATVQTATASLCRQAALSSLALACADYQPSSSNDATALRDTVADLFDAEILRLADSGQGEAYSAFRALRGTVIMDLNTRGATLPSLITVTTAQPMPSLGLAYRLYADATRADELTARSNAQSSMFLPTSFQALSR